MRLIDADELEIDEIDDVRCYSILQVEEALTIQAVPIDVLDKISDEINKLKKVSDGNKVYVGINEVLDIIDNYTK